jgi:WD40 repeat protein
MLWDASSGQLVRRFDGHSGSVTAVAFSRDGSRVLSGSADRTIGIWNAATGELLTTLMGEQ